MTCAITNQNDIFVYYEIIRQVKPSSIIDFGMFLKRVGAVSRQLMDREISRTILLDGADYIPETDYKVLRTIYNNIYRGGIAGLPDKRYDMAFIMRPSSVMTAEEEEKIWRWLRKHASYAVTDCCSAKRLQDTRRRGAFTDIKVENDIYGLVQL